VLDAPVEVDLKTPIQEGDIITRGYQLDLFRPQAGQTPVASVPLRIEGQYAPVFSGGVCFDKNGNLFFLDGPRNLRLHMIPAGKSRSEVLCEIPESQTNPYLYGSDLISPAPGSLWLITSDGILHTFKVTEKGAELTGESQVADGGHCINMALSPDKKWLAIVNGECVPKRNIFMFSTDPMKEVCVIGTTNLKNNYTSGIAFIPGTPGFLAVCSETPAGEGKAGEYGNLLRIEMDSKTGQMSAPTQVNMPDLKAFSLLHSEYRVDAVSCDQGSGRILFACRSPQGSRLYCIPLEQFAKGQIQEKDLSSIGISNYIRHIAVSPKLKK